MPLPGSSRQIEFGEFTLDLDTGELRSNGRKLTLQGQPFQILKILLEQPGRLLTRDELKKKLWPSDTFVDFDHGLNKAVNRLREALDDSADHPKFIETLARRGYRFIAPVTMGTATHQTTGFRHVSAEADSGESSIAVLPFTNISADPQNEFFADGITEEIINILTRINDLRVAARTSAFAFKGKHVDLRIVGQRLNVKTILEGSVRRAGNRVRIMAELTNVADGYHLWSERYDRELTDIFAIQEEIAQAIVAHLKLRLTRLDQPLVIRPTESISAYHAYLEGRYQSYRYAPNALERSREFFEKATHEDPNFSLAYVGLTDYYIALASLGLRKPYDVLPRAEEVAQKALELDGSQGEIHASLGVLAVLSGYDWDRAESLFQTALRTNPRSPLVRNLYAFWVLRPLGRLPEALNQSTALLLMDPLSPFFRYTKAYLLYLNRQYNDAIEQSNRTLELDSNFYLAYRVLGMALAQQGKFSEALAALERSKDFFPGALNIGLLASTLAQAGQCQRAERLLDQLQAQTGYVPSTIIAGIRLALKQQDEAFVLLNRALEEHDPLILGVNVDPAFDRYRSDSRWVSLKRTLHLS
jgi:TolB-like protein/Tfp pilus assembly protein PilF